MTRRERVRRSLLHKESDIVPYSLSLTIPAMEKMVRFYGDPAFSDKIGNHVGSVGRADLPGESGEVRPGFFRDSFGVVWDRTADPDIGVIREFPVTAENYRSYPLPDPRDPRCYAGIPDAIRKQDGMFIMAGIGFSFFERAWTLAGMENLLVAFADDPGFVDGFLDRIAEWILAVVREFNTFEGVDAVHFGDDWGQQHGLIMGPRFWRRYIKPRLAVIYAEVKKAGKFVSIHSCGDIREILPDLVEIGLDCFNPFQPEVMDVHEMKRLHGDRLSFFGGISLQKTLAFGTPDDVRRETLDRLETIGRGGGYIANACHAITRDVPEANIDALIRTLMDQPRRPVAD